MSCIFFLRYKTPIHHVLLCYRWLLCQWQYSWYFFLCYRWFCFSILDQKFAITDWMICIEFFLSTTKHPYTLLLCYIWSLYHWIFPPIFSVLLFLLKCCPFSKKNFHYWLVDLQKKILSYKTPIYIVFNATGGFCVSGSIFDIFSPFFFLWFLLKFAFFNQKFPLLTGWFALMLLS